MTPAAIARNAWHAKDTRAPLDSILDALGLDDIPTVRTCGPGVVRRWTETLNEWRDLLAERGMQAALPDNRFRQQHPPGTHYRLECGVCGAAFSIPPHLKGRRKYCGVPCANRARQTDTDPALVERNLEIVRLAESGLTYREIGARYDRSTGLISKVVCDWRAGEGWAADIDREEAAA